MKPAPTFELQDLNGSRAALASLKGKVVIVDFWATWCGPCIQEIPEYAEFWRKNQPKGVEVIGVVMDSGSPQEINDFVRDNKIPYRQLIGDEKTAEAFGVNQGYPTTFVIDAQGHDPHQDAGQPADQVPEAAGGRRRGARVLTAADRFRGESVSVTKEQVLSALRGVQDPDLHKDIVTLGFVKDVEVEGRRGRLHDRADDAGLPGQGPDEGAGRGARRRRCPASARRGRR